MENGFYHLFVDKNIFYFLVGCLKYTYTQPAEAIYSQQFIRIFEELGVPPRDDTELSNLTLFDTKSHSQLH